MDTNKAYTITLTPQMEQFVKNQAVITGETIEQWINRFADRELRRHLLEPATR